MSGTYDFDHEPRTCVPPELRGILRIELSHGSTTFDYHAVAAYIAGKVVYSAPGQIHESSGTDGVRALVTRFDPKRVPGDTDYEKVDHLVTLREAIAAELDLEVRIKASILPERH